MPSRSVPREWHELLSGFGRTTSEGLWGPFPSRSFSQEAKWKETRKITHILLLTSGNEFTTHLKNTDCVPISALGVLLLLKPQR